MSFARKSARGWLLGALAVLACLSCEGAGAASLLDDLPVADMAPAESSPLRYVCIFYVSNRHHLDIGFEAANRGQRHVSVDNSFTDRSDDRLSLGVAKISVPNFRQLAEQGEDGQENPLRDFAALQLGPSRSVADFEDVLRSPPPPADCLSGPGKVIADGTPLLYVHGWKAKLSTALDRAAQLAVDLKRAGPVVAFDWPSDTDYPRAETEEKTAQRKLHAVLTMISVAAKRRADVVAHSLGTRLLFDSLRHWAADSASPSDARAMIESVVMAAPDLGRTDFLHDIKPLRHLIEGRLTVYCTLDFALAASTVKHFFENRLGFCLSGPPRLAEAESVAVRGPMADIYSHSYFLSAPQMILDMESVLTRAPTTTDGTMRTITLH